MPLDFLEVSLGLCIGICVGAEGTALVSPNDDEEDDNDAGGIWAAGASSTSVPVAAMAAGDGDAILLSSDGAADSAEVRTAEGGTKHSREAGRLGV